MTRIDIDRYQTLGRRALLRDLGATAAAFAGGAAWTRRVWAQPVFRRYPFSLGVASGDPLPDGVVLWTRLAPEPLAGGGMPNQAVEVGWELAQDARFTRIVQKGTAVAPPELGHAVHVEAFGLEPARDYYYRFVAGKEKSPVGRTRTAPAPGAPVGSLKLGVAGCQRYEDGYFTAWRHLAAENFDVVFHYGDYIYEYRGRTSPELVTRPTPRTFDFDEIYTLVDYRTRYGVYKLDPDLQAAHASAPFLVSFDDHEVDNNHAGEHDENGTPPELFLLRRQAAYQAFYEHMPLRRASLPRGPQIQLYRRLDWGGLAQINVLDTRQYRTDQACDDTMGPRCEGEGDPSATILGAAQADWLERGLGSAGAPWKVLAQQVMVAQLDRAGDPAAPMISPDKWDGYLASRRRLLDFVDRHGVEGLVVLTGDIHNNWAANLLRDFDVPASRVLGSEFVATSISSGGDGADRNPDTDKVLAGNPHVRFFNNQRGYLRCLVTPERWRTDYRVVERVSTPDAPIGTRASYASGHAEAGVVAA